MHIHSLIRSSIKLIVFVSALLFVTACGTSQIPETRSIVNTDSPETSSGGDSTDNPDDSEKTFGDEISSDHTSSGDDPYRNSQILNDTGINWGGDFFNGNNAACSSNIDARQDCNVGRDAQAAAGNLIKSGAGKAGFDLTRLNADGSEYTGSGNFAMEPWSCVRDNVTNLTWEVKVTQSGLSKNTKKFRWGGTNSTGKEINAGRRASGIIYPDWLDLIKWANEANANQGLCGITDWRVPTINELTSLSNFGLAYPALDTDYFPNTVTNAHYWTSTAFASGTEHAWSIHSADGSGSYRYRGESHYVRLVFGGKDSIAAQFVNSSYIGETGRQDLLLSIDANTWIDARYFDHDDGTVTDIQTGLMWKKCSQGQVYNRANNSCEGLALIFDWEQALKNSNEEAYAGHNDWRLPNTVELRTLIAFDHSAPAINLHIFPSTQREWYWSSSPNANLSSSSWAVNFDLGIDESSIRIGYYHSRLVRVNF